MDCRVTSEYGDLEYVLVKTPGEEILRLTPSNKDEYLFEDIPYLHDMRIEHEQFINILKEKSKAKVLYVDELLENILSDNQVKERMISMIVSLENCEGIADYLRDLSPKELATKLITGLQIKECPLITGETREDRESFLLEPIPNMYFTRDPAAIVMNGVVSCNMSKSKRRKESILMRYIFKYHDHFKGINFLFGENPDERNPFIIEGGDILILNKQAIAIGRSERTCQESIQRLARNLFDKMVCERVYEIPIPGERVFMHLDTVFTIIDKDLVVVYPDALEKYAEDYLNTYYAVPVGDHIEAKRSLFRGGFLEMLNKEFGSSCNLVRTGGEDRIAAAREQFCDGTNVFAIAPRKVITYDRNEKTNKALEDAGVQVFAVRGSELVRGRGGPRCMTMPLCRKDT